MKLLYATTEPDKSMGLHSAVVAKLLVLILQGCTGDQLIAAAGWTGLNDKEQQKRLTRFLNNVGRNYKKIGLCRTWG